MSDPFYDFVVESNRIEGITDDASHIIALDWLEKFMALDTLTLKDVCEFNTAGELRDKSGMDVIVGKHRPPDGGTFIRTVLKNQLQQVNLGRDPYFVHCDFETLHPFMDGNGRTGRAIWLWQMVNQQDYRISLGFLHAWYYQSLEHAR